MLNGKLAFTSMLLVGVVSLCPLSAISEGIKGRYEMQGQSPIVIADRVYLVTDLTLFTDQSGKHMAMDELFPGRAVEVESFVGLGESSPATATRITVLEPH
jgi:hypothetical protein